jgi:2-oxoglutarate/2-oxoacid ferredoxin oxidoreductase subunit alpha
VGPADADITLVCWGSNYGIVRDAVELLEERGVKANFLPIKWIVPFHGKEVMEVLSKAKKVIVVENNYSGQFYRYMRSETGLSVDGHIRKYDGEPFMPHHIADGVVEHLGGKAAGKFIPFQEVVA